VAERGNLGRAAEALGLGQPALSKSLRRLEQIAGARLFARTAKGVELTPAGAALLSRVRRLRLAVDDVAQELADIGRGHAGHLRIGAPAGFMEYPLSGAARAMMQEAPDVTVTVDVATVDILLPALQKGDLDLAVTPMTASPKENLVQEHLFDDEFVVIASLNHRLAERKRVTIADLAQEQWILSTSNAISPLKLFRAFEDAGLPAPRVILKTPSLRLRDILVSSTDCLGYSSTRVARSARPRVRFAEFRIKELAWIRRVAVAYRSESYLSPIAQRFVEILKTQSKVSVRPAYRP
jgi:DNA-binding transcriptional LysR family regulator